MHILPISFQDVLNAKELLAEYAAECSIPAIGPIDPQPQIYKSLEDAQVMQCFGAFDPDLIGFGNVLMSVFPHYGRKIATIESLFVAHAHRRTSAGSELMRVIEGFVKDAGCEGILYSAPAQGKLERLLEAKKQYHRTNAVFYRSL